STACFGVPDFDVIISPAGRSALPSTCGGRKFSGQTAGPVVSSLNSCCAIGSLTFVAENRLSAGKTPVALYQESRFAGVCSQTRNAAAAALSFAHEVMNASEDCVVSYVWASLPWPQTGVWPTPIFAAPSVFSHASALPSVVHAIAAFCCGKSCQPWFR